MREVRNQIDEIRREHALIRRSLGEIDGELERLRSEPGPAHRPGELLGMLVMFRHHLRRHFELEESGEFLVDREEVDPGVRRRIRTLLEEHRSMMSRLDSMIQSLERVECGSACLPEAFGTELGDLTADLRAHERSENQLAQELVSRDVGVGD